MKIYIYTGNHGNSLSIADLVEMVRQAAIDAGYDASVSHELMSGHCNILIEHFVGPTSLADLVDRKTPGTRYVLLCTELITGNTFNSGVVGNHWHYSNDDYWKERFDGFMFAAGLADAVWVLSDLVVPAYEAVVRGTPVRYLPHGWVSGLDRVHHRPEADKDIDFFFSGSLTPHRREILAALSVRYGVAVLPQATPDYLRLDLMARAKVCLSLRLSPSNTLPSVSRMHYNLVNANFMLHQAYEQGSALDPYVLHVPADDIVEWASAALAMTNRREVAEGALTRFRQEMPLARFIGPLLAEAMQGAGTRAPVPAAA